MSFVLKERPSRTNTALVVIDVQESLYPHIHDHELMLQNIVRLVRGARIIDVPVIATEQYTKGLGFTVAELRALFEPSLIFEKTYFSAFRHDDFANALREAAARNLLFVGTESHVCVLQTALDALRRGFGTYIVADAVGSRRETDRHFALRRLEQAGAVLTTVESVAFELLDQSNTDLFRAALPLFR